MSGIHVAGREQGMSLCEVRNDRKCLKIKRVLA